MVLTIYGHGGHPEFRIKTILSIFRSPNAWMLHMKFGYIWPSRLKVWTDDGRTMEASHPISSTPTSLRLWGAKNFVAKFLSEADLIFDP